MSTILENERVLATKIAYVGASGTGKSSNLKQIRKLPTASSPSSPAETVLWRPTHMGKFKGELEIHVTLDAIAGTDDLAAIVSGYDGIVLVVEPTEATLARDAAVVAALRPLLTAGGPSVVVQINKRDLPGALAADDVAARLQISDFPHFSASADGGNGVLETLGKVVRMVLGKVGGTDVFAARTEAPREEANLPPTAGGIMRRIDALDGSLAARLEQVAMMADRLEGLEGAFSTRIDRLIGAQALDLASIRAAQIPAEALLSPLGIRIDALERSLLGRIETIVEAQALEATANKSIFAAISAIATSQAEAVRSHESLARELTVLNARLIAVARDATAINEATGAQRSEIKAFSAALAAEREEFAARDRSARDQIANVERTVALVAEQVRDTADQLREVTVRQLDQAAHNGEVTNEIASQTNALANVNAAVEVLGRTLREFAPLPRAVMGVEEALQKALTGQDALGERLETLENDLASIAEGVSALGADLKKPKGWFGG